VTTLTVMVWNIEWAEPESRRGRLIRAAIDALAPDVLCLPEAPIGFMDDPDRTVASTADHGYRSPPERRKVVLWSRRGWRGIDTVGDPGLPPGRFVAATTDTLVGPVTVVGVCVPWSHAHVTGGRRDRRPWEEHLAYLDGLERHLRGRTDRDRLLVLGDINQRIPRTRQAEAVFDRLVAAVPDDLRVATAGPVPPLGVAMIDHVFAGHGLTVDDVRALDRVIDGVEVSDHHGLVVTIAG
jgi:endonuclease/exonuclease/phosphatase family metal-dependent hydrolase